MVNNMIVYVTGVLLIATSLSVSAQLDVAYSQCTTPGGEFATCMPLEECAFLYNILLSRQLKYSDRLFLKRSQCDSYGRQILMCCPERYTDRKQPQLTTRGSLPDPAVHCSLTIGNRLFGGSDAEFDEFRWAALILYDNFGEISHHCGGSLINTRYVLTAAHCIALIPKDWKAVSVRLGEWDTSTNPDCKKIADGGQDCADHHVDVPIESILIHPDYVPTSRNQRHDIALLRLSTIVQYTDFIRPICLPIKEDLRKASLDGMNLDISGWGRTETGRSNIKLKATVRVASLSNCQQLYGQNNISIEASQMCAGGQKGISTCNGDSGGALVALDTSDPSKVYNYIAGIISFGPSPCGFEGFPEIYTKVGSYVDWIQENIQP